MMRTTLFAALAGHVAACDLASMGTQTEAMNSKCCAGNNCDATGVPRTCTDECRPAFETFWKDCGAYMAYVPGTEPMKDFAAQCEDSKPDGTGSKETECDAGSLLTTVLPDVSQQPFELPHLLIYRDAKYRQPADPSTGAAQHPEARDRPASLTIC